MAGWTPPAGTTTRWLLACMAGLGVGLPLAALWDLTVMRDLVLPPAWRVGMATVALRAVGGAITGFCLGVAQAWALRHTYPSLTRLRWVGATAAAGFLTALASMAAWGLLMLQYEQRPMLAFLVAGPLVSGLCGGLIYGLAQGFVLGGGVRAVQPAMGPRRRRHAHFGGECGGRRGDRGAGARPGYGRRLPLHAAPPSSLIAARRLSRAGAS